MFYLTPQGELLLQIFLAAILGGMIGLEREYKRKEAGLKTFALVSFAACFLTIIDVSLTSKFVVPGTIKLDPSRIIQAVAIGVGFIGAGLIIHKQGEVEGLTTAAALWATAAVGVGIGEKMYFISIISAFLIVAILSIMRLVEEKIFKKFPEDRSDG